MAELEDHVPEQDFTLEGATFVLRIADARSMQEEHTSRLEAAIREVARQREVALLALAAPDLRNVPPGVITIWLKRGGDASLRIRAIAVVTTRSAVRVAANGFGQAIKLLRVPLQIQVFETEPPARAWLTGLGFFRGD